MLTNTATTTTRPSPFTKAEYAIPSPQGGQAAFRDNNVVWRIADTTPQRDALPKGAPAETAAGFYMETDTLNSGTPRKSSTEIKAETSGDYNVRVVKLGGLELAGCYAAVNSSEIAIPAGLYCEAKDGNGNTYPAWLVPVNFSNNTIDMRGTVKGAIDAAGNIRFGSWGIFAIKDGEVIGSVCIMTSSLLEPCNATMECTDLNGVKTSWGLKVTQGYQNEITVENFGNTGAPANITLFYDKTVQIVPQFMGSVTGYGNFFNVALAANGKSDLNTLMTGTMPDLSTINLPSWGITDMSSVDAAVARYASGVIRFKTPITLPARVETTLQGSGTQSAPYLITSYNDLRWLAQYIREGGDTQGKYYKLTRDISCASSQYVFETLAQLTSCNDYGYGTNPFAGRPFLGHLDGDGHRITDITIQTGNVSCVGFIGWLGYGATVRNLNMSDNMVYSEGCGLATMIGVSQGVITNCRVTDNGIIGGGCQVGGICGVNKGRIEQCYAADEILSCGTAGSVCGITHGTVRGCEALSSIVIYPTSFPLHRYIGGIVGQCNAAWSIDEFPGVIENCVAAARITNTQSADAVTAGMAGSLLSNSNKAPATLRNCAGITSIVTVGANTTSGLTGMAAGIVGTNSYAAVENVLSTGLIMSKNMMNSLGAVSGYVSTGKSSFANIISAVQIVVPGAPMAANKALFGNLNSDIMSWCKNVYYDKQLFGLTYSELGYTGAKSVAELTGSSAPSGISAGQWTVTEGLYPRPAAVADKEIAMIAAAPVVFAEGEVANMIRHNFTVSTANGVKWGVETQSGIGTTGNGVTIQGSSVTVRDDYASDVLDAYITATGPVKSVMIDIVPSTLFKGQGTQQDPYQLSTVTDLKNLADATGQYAQTYEGYYFRVMNDIDCMGDAGFVGISADGVDTHIFNGEIDGAGFTIDNMNINRLVTDIYGTPNLQSTPAGVAFVGRLGSTGVLKNLHFGSGCKVRGGFSTAGVAGIAQGRVENCSYAGTVEGHGTFTAGVVGQHPAGAKGVSGCLFSGTVYGSKNYTAGVAGGNGALIDHCMNIGKVVCDSLSAGDRIADCRYVGGVCGYVQGGVLKHCTDLGYVQGNTSVGGIAGYCSGSVRIDSCLSAGTTYTYLISGAQGALAGSLPSSNGTIVFTDCVYDGQVSVGKAVGNNGRVGCMAMRTDDLTAGNAIEALGSGWLNYTASQYPVPTRFMDNPQVKAMRAIVLTLGAGQNVTDVYGTAALSNPEGIEWKAVSTPAIYEVSANTLTVIPFSADNVASGTVTGSLNGVSRCYNLKSVPAIFAGQGSKDSPFEIRTKEDMTKLATWVNTKSVTFDGRYFRMLNDIDFAGDTTFVTIGNEPAVFGGQFDGAGHTILNLDYTPKAAGPASLFGTVNSAGGVCNLTLRGGAFHSSQEGRKGAASFVYSLAGRMENCVNYNEVDGTGFNYGDGIVREILSGGVASRCVNYGKVTAKLGSSGGVCGEVKADGLLEYCENHGQIVVTGSTVGGIAGRCYGTIAHCVNHTDITSPKSTIGGIVANLAAGGSVLDCVNRGNITLTGATGYVAGIAQASTATGMTVMRCVNYGSITCEGNTSMYAAGILNRSGASLRMDSCVNHGDIATGKGQYTAGILAYVSGKTDNQGLITNCYNYGKVTGNGNHVGGLIAYITNDSIAGCGNYGAVTANASAKNLVGGLAGYCSGAAWNGCFNCGDVTSAAYYTAGCFGSMGTNTRARECANTGNVTSTATTGTASYFTVAGFAANMVSGTITDCFNLGNVQGNKYVAGFMGRCQKNSTFERDYSAAAVTAGEGVTTVYPFIGSVPSATTYADNYFDADRWARTDIESTGSLALETCDLLGRKLSGAWVAIPATYPILACMDTVVPVNFAAAQILYADDDASQHVFHTMTIGLPLGVSWVCSDNLRIETNRVVLLVKNKKNVPAWLKKSARGGLEQTFALTLMNDSGADSIELSVEKREYYTPDGLRVLRSTPGQIVIERCIYTDGTVTVTRRVMR